MSTDVRTQAGQVEPAGREPQAGATGALRENPQAIIQESIKYRRRAQEAERRAEALEAEIQGLHQGQDDRLAAIEADLASAKAEAEVLRGRLESVERDRRLERELLRAGCIDAEAGLALARQRLDGGQMPDDLAALARSLLEEKPYLRGGTSGDPPTGPRVAQGLPPPTSAAKPAGDGSPRRAAERLAGQARQTGSSRDLMAYMRARRAGA